jgi:HEAT repeat protein
VLALLAPLVTFRVWGYFASHTQVREEMLGNILSLLDRQTIAPGEDARTIGALLAALRHADYDVSAASARALKQMGEATLEPLPAALQDQSYRVREGAAQALGQLGDARAIKPLSMALKDKDYGVSTVAAQALGQLEMRALQPLLSGLKEALYGVRQSATVQALDAFSISHAAFAVARR